MTLTTRQQDTLAFVASYCDTHGVRPSYRAIMDAVGFTSTSNVSYELNRLADLGALRLVRSPESGRVRDIVVPR